MTKSMFSNLQNILDTQTDMKNKSVHTHGGRPELSTEMRLFITLNYLGSRLNVRKLAKLYCVSESTVMSSMRKVVGAVYQLMPNFIQWPNGSKTQETADNFYKMTGMPRVVGVLDVSHIQVRAPVAQRDYYTNMKGKLSIILQAVCNDKMKFMHCCTGWPGSVDDASVLHDSDLYLDVQKQPTNFFPSGHYLVADSAYPIQDWLLTPFDENSCLNDAEIKFNQIHKSTQEVIQKAFVHLKSRFPRLHFIDLNEMEDIVKVILVCCALHNYCHEAGDTELFTDGGDAENGETDVGTDVEFHIHQEDGLVRRQEITQILAYQ